MTPLVTVLTPVLNGERTMPALIAAIRSQLPPVSSRLDGVGYEWIVVDNGSSDGTRDIVASAQLPELRMMEESRRGPSAARNRGLREARGAVVAMIDADCVATRPWLRELVAAFDDPRVIVVGGGLASFPPRTAAQRFAASYGLNDAARMISMPKMPFANTRNLAVLREAALAVGGLPEDLIAGEDVEFSYLLRQRFSCPITFRPSALTLHQDREDDESLEAQAVSYGRSMAAIYARHPDILEWGVAQQVRRLRTTGSRRLNATVHGVVGWLGRGDAAEQEFARYLALWNGWFWRGFDEGRRSAAAPQ
jgi:glycosyltransferase involved in cell wall biosynthesis